jgi:PKD repeat protein
VTSNFTVDTASGAAPLNVTFSNASSTNGIGTLTYLWDFGSGSLTSTKLNPTMSYHDAGVYNVSLQVTESYYGVHVKTTKSSFITAS